MWESWVTKTTLLERTETSQQTGTKQHRHYVLVLNSVNYLQVNTTFPLQVFVTERPQAACSEKVAHALLYSVNTEMKARRVTQRIHADSGFALFVPKWVLRWSSPDLLRSNVSEVWFRVQGRIMGLPKEYPPPCAADPKHVYGLKCLQSVFSRGSDTILSTQRENAQRRGGRTLEDLLSVVLLPQGRFLESDELVHVGSRLSWSKALPKVWPRSIKCLEQLSEQNWDELIPFDRVLNV